MLRPTLWTKAISERMPVADWPALLADPRRELDWLEQYAALGFGLLGFAASVAPELGEAGITNVRFCQLDAVWAFREAMAPAAITELLTFFPDPWHKKRHHKRRLLNADFASLTADRVVQGGVWRIATDWPAYAEHIRECFAEVTDLWEGGESERWPGRPLTKFERRGLAEGRPITDFTFRRR